MQNWKTEIHFKETPIANDTDGKETNTEISGDKVTEKATGNAKTSELSTERNNKKDKKCEPKKRFVRDTYRQGDVVVIDFGQPFDSLAPRSKRPCVIISRDEIVKKSSQILVIPLYRSEPGKNKEVEKHENDVAEIPRLYGVQNIFISKKVCSGLHYDMYLQPVSVQLISKFRIQRKIGRIRENVVICEIVNSVWNAISRDFT